MNPSRKKYAVTLAVLLAMVFVCMTIANLIQSDNGNVSITEGVIACDAGNVSYKLYTPSSASAANPAPAVLMLHGYQNDHETCAGYAIELARRGAVVMAIDEYGHGTTEPGLLSRGYVNHKVTVNYGNDSEEAGTFVEIGGQKRYRVMMNFSNLSFFDAHYSADDAGNSITDSSAGGVAAYAVLADLDCVDATRMAVSGHSMGTWSSWSVAAAYSGATNLDGADIAPKAIVLQCGELFRQNDSVYDTGSIYFNNVLLLQAKYDEFSYFRDYQNTVDDALLQSDTRTEFLGCTANEAAWDTTYGDFSNGSARRIELLNTNHRLTTHNAQGLTAALNWFGDAIDLDLSIAAQSHVAQYKEWLVLIAMLCAVAAMLPLMELLLTTKVFAYVRQPLPCAEDIKPKGKWWRGAVITILIAGLSFPFMTQLGHGLLPLPEGFFRMTVGNGFLSWYGLLILVMLATTIVGRLVTKKKGKTPVSYYSMGLGSSQKPNGIDWKLCGLSALLTLCMVALIYAVTAICQTVYHLDLRFIWPFFKTFTITRFGQFCAYILIFALFYVLNNSKIMASMRTQGLYQPGVKGFMSCWWRNALVMSGGVLLIVLIEYIPFFAGIGPGCDLLFGSTFGGPFISLLILFVPQVLAFSLLCTYTYRRTGNVYTGAFVAATLACWIVTGGSAML